MIKSKLGKDLRLGLIVCDKLMALLAAQARSLEAVRSDLEGLRVELRRRIKPDGVHPFDAPTNPHPDAGYRHSRVDSCTRGTNLVQRLEDAAADLGYAGNALATLAAVATGATWPTVEELGQCGLLRDGANGRAVSLTPDELAAWLTTLANRLLEVANTLRGVSEHADLTGTTQHLGRYLRV